jgi:hypothetical protein
MCSTASSASKIASVDMGLQEIESTHTKQCDLIASAAPGAIFGDWCMDLVWLRLCAPQTDRMSAK